MSGVPGVCCPVCPVRVLSGVHVDLESPHTMAELAADRWRTRRCPWRVSLAVSLACVPGVCCPVCPVRVLSGVHVDLESPHTMAELAAAMTCDRGHVTTPACKASTSPAESITVVL